MRNKGWIPGGTFLMSSNYLYSEECPEHRVSVDGVWMDDRPVTNAEARRFIKATVCVTITERPPNPKAYPGSGPALFAPGSLAFRKPVHLTARASVTDTKAHHLSVHSRPTAVGCTTRQEMYQRFFHTTPPGGKETA